MSTPRNHLAELTPEFWPSRGLSVHEPKDNEPRRVKYTTALEIVSQPDTMKELVQAVTSISFSAATILPRKVSIFIPRFRIPKDYDFNSFPASEDPIAELAEELWRRKKARFPRFPDLPIQIRELIYEEALRNGMFALPVLNVQYKLW